MESRNSPVPTPNAASPSNTPLTITSLNIEDSLDRSQLTEKQYLILVEYQKMLSSLKQINSQIESLNKSKKNSNGFTEDDDKNNSSSADLIENLRFLENRIGLLFTLIKSSAFSFIVKHQQDLNYGDEENDNDNIRENGDDDDEGGKPTVVSNGILQSADGTVNVTLDSTR